MSGTSLSILGTVSSLNCIVNDTGTSGHQVSQQCLFKVPLHPTSKHASRLISPSARTLQYLSVTGTLLHSPARIFDQIVKSTRGILVRHREQWKHFKRRTRSSNIDHCQKFQ